MRLKLFIGGDDFKYVEKENFIYKIDCKKEDVDKYILDDSRKKLLFIEGYNEKNIPKIYHIENFGFNNNITKIGEGNIKNNTIIFKNQDIKTIFSKEKQEKINNLSKIKREKQIKQENIIKEKNKQKNKEILKKINKEYNEISLY